MTPHASTSALPTDALAPRWVDACDLGRLLFQAERPDEAAFGLASVHIGRDQPQAVLELRP
ncbi:MAG: hypothetical protein EPN20_04490 [Magnetospirillum sp.]|nr:MAG: hypothetical protein EPN20_04490 [Magnetospirillum sp.]